MRSEESEDEEEKEFLDGLDPALRLALRQSATELLNTSNTAEEGQRMNLTIKPPEGSGHRPFMVTYITVSVIMLAYMLYES